MIYTENRLKDETEQSDDDICCPLCPTISCLFNHSSCQDLNENAYYMEELLPFPNLTYPTEEILYHILGEYAGLIDHYSNIFIDSKLSELDGTLVSTNYHQKHQRNTSTQTKTRLPFKLDMELRGGKFIPCICKKTHGLQDFCERTGCMGSPDCLKFPPECLPSLFEGKPQRIIYPRTKFGLSETVTTGSSAFQFFVDEHPQDCGNCFECFKRNVALWLRNQMQAQLGNRTS